MPSVAKQPWEMIKQEWYSFLRTPESRRVSSVTGTSHYNIIRDALDEGKPLPPKVLKEYPELMKITKTVKGADNPMPRGTRKLLRADQISDFGPTDRVVREGDKTFVVDTKGAYRRIEVQSDKLTEAVIANLKSLTPEQQAKMRQVIETTPYLSSEGKAERLAVLPPVISDADRQFMARVLKQPPAKPKKEWGVTLQNANPEAVKKAILEFLDTHEGVLIHPKQDMTKLIQQMVTLGYCPCLRTALSCPHPNVETQIKAEGKCACNLFVTEAWLKQYYVKEGVEWLPMRERITPTARVGAVIKKEPITFLKQLTPIERAELRFVEPRPSELSKEGKLWVAEGLKPVHLHGPFSNYEELRSYIRARITRWNETGIAWQSFRHSSPEIKEVQSYARDLMERLRGGPA